MKYKVGDRLLCKREYVLGPRFVGSDERLYLKDVAFDSGKFYTVFDSWPFRDEMLLSITNNFGGQISFNIDPPKLNSIGAKFLSDYFYTKEEMRKLKLDKINGI